MTREGLRFALVGVAAVILGLVAGWDGPLVLGAAILILVPCAIAFVQAPTKAEIAHAPRSVQCERLSDTTLEITIRTSRRVGVFAEVASDPEPRRLHRLARRHDFVTLTLSVDTRRRFAGAIGPVHFVRRDPFGICRRVIASTDPIDLVVTPRITSTPHTPTREHSSSDEQNPRTSQGQATVSETTREYIPGDEPRRIHWRSSARLGQLMVRQETGTPSADVTIILDRAVTTWNTAPSFRNDNSADNFELAVETVAALIDDLLPTGRTIELLCTDEGTVAIDRTAERTFLRILASVTTSSGSTLNGRDFARVARNPRGTHLIVVTRGRDNFGLVHGVSPRARVVEPHLPDVNP